MNIIIKKFNCIRMPNKIVNEYFTRSKFHMGDYRSKSHIFSHVWGLAKIIKTVYIIYFATVVGHYLVSISAALAEIQRTDLHCLIGYA